MRPKHEGPPTGNVGFRFVSFRAVRDVSCVRRRARDRSIARALLGGLISVMIDPWPRQILEIFLLVITGLFLHDFENRLRSRTRVATFDFLKMPSWIYEGGTADIF